MKFKRFLAALLGAMMVVSCMSFVANAEEAEVEAAAEEIAAEAEAEEVIAEDETEE